MTRKDLEKQGYKAVIRFYCEQNAKTLARKLREEGKEVKIIKSSKMIPVYYVYVKKEDRNG